MKPVAQTAARAASRVEPMGRRCLLVEDDVRVREVLAAYLAVDGFDVSIASDGVEGLTKALEDVPDLIVTDIMMPRKDGIAMVKEMRADERLNKVPVLFISGHSDPPDGEELRSGPMAYVAKPVTLGGFLTAVRKLMRTASQHG